MGKTRLKTPKKRDWIFLFVGIVLAVIGYQVYNFILDSQVPVKNEGKGITTAWIPPSVASWNDPINEMAEKYNVDPNLIAIIITLESGGYSKAKSEAGAIGLMQITPPTAGDIASKHLKEPTTNYDLYDPKTNIEFGTAYIAYLRTEFGEPNQRPSWDKTVELIAAGYNGGPGAANKIYKGEGLTDTQTVVYSRDAFNMWRERNVQTSPTFDRWKERGGLELIEKANNENI